MGNQNWRPGQPVPLDITEINPYKKQTYSEFGNGGGYEVKGGFRALDPADFGMARFIKDAIINALPDRYEKIRLKLEDQYNETLQTIEVDIQSELIAAGLSADNTHKTVQTISLDKTIVVNFSQNRNVQLLTSQHQANNFSGSDPLTLTREQLITVTRNRFVSDPGQFDKSAAHQLKTYANSARAAYKARLLTTAIQILNNKSNVLDLNLAAVHAHELAQIAAQEEAQRQAQIAAQQEAQRQAQITAQQEAQRQAQITAQQEAHRQAQIAAQQETQRQAQIAAQQETQRQAQIAAQQETQRQAQIAAQQETQRQAQIAAQREALRQARIAQTQRQAGLLVGQSARSLFAARQAERQKYQKIADELADEFDEQFEKLALDQPENIDEKLRWMRQKYQQLYAAHLEAEKRNAKQEGFTITRDIANAGVR